MSSTAFKSSRQSAAIPFHGKDFNGLFFLHVAGFSGRQLVFVFYIYIYEIIIIIILLIYSSFSEGASNSFALSEGTLFFLFFFSIS